MSTGDGRVDGVSCLCLGNVTAMLAQRRLYHCCTTRDDPANSNINKSCDSSKIDQSIIVKIFLDLDFRYLIIDCGELENKRKSPVVYRYIVSMPKKITETFRYKYLIELVYLISYTLQCIHIHHIIIDSLIIIVKVGQDETYSTIMHKLPEMSCTTMCFGYLPSRPGNMIFLESNISFCVSLSLSSHVVLVTTSRSKVSNCLCILATLHISQRGEQSGLSFS